MPPASMFNLPETDRMSILEARLKEIRATQALITVLNKFKAQYPSATVGEIESFKLGYQAALNNQ